MDPAQAPDHDPRERMTPGAVPSFLLKLAGTIAPVTAKAGARRRIDAVQAVPARNQTGRGREQDTRSEREAPIISMAGSDGGSAAQI